MASLALVKPCSQGRLSLLVGCEKNHFNEKLTIASRFALMGVGAPLACGD